MNILDAVLLTCKAQQYSNQFKTNGITAFTLKILNDEDLKALGIHDDEVRSAILQHALNLQIPAEKYIDLVVDRMYVESVLLQMSAQLRRHLAALSIAVNREDTIVCNIKLTPAAICLKNCVSSLEKQFDGFQTKIIVKPRAKSRVNWKMVLLSSTFLVSSLVITYKMYRVNCKLI